MNSTALTAGRIGPSTRLCARKTFAAALLMCAVFGTPAAHAKDPCKTVVCMWGKFTGKDGGSGCQPAVKDYFDIVIKKKKGRIDWDATSSERKKLLDSCPTADGGFTKKINDMFGKAGG